MLTTLPVDTQASYRSDPKVHGEWDGTEDGDNGQTPPAQFEDITGIDEAADKCHRNICCVGRPRLAYHRGSVAQLFAMQRFLARVINSFVCIAA